MPPKKRKRAGPSLSGKKKRGPRSDVSQDGVISMQSGGSTAKGPRLRKTVNCKQYLEWFDALTAFLIDTAEVPLLTEMVHIISEFLLPDTRLAYVQMQIVKEGGICTLSLDTWDFVKEEMCSSNARISTIPPTLKDSPLVNYKDIQLIRIGCAQLAGRRVSPVGIVLYDVSYDYIHLLVMFIDGQTEFEHFAVLKPKTVVQQTGGWRFPYGEVLEDGRCILYSDIHQTTWVWQLGGTTDPPCLAEWLGGYAYTICLLNNPLRVVIPSQTDDRRDGTTKVYDLSTYSMVLDLKTYYKDVTALSDDLLAVIDTPGTVSILSLSTLTTTHVCTCNPSIAIRYCPYSRLSALHDGTLTIIEDYKDGELMLARRSCSKPESVPKHMMHNVRDYGSRANVPYDLVLYAGAANVQTHDQPPAAPPTRTSRPMELNLQTGITRACGLTVNTDTSDIGSMMGYGYSLFCDTASQWVSQLRSSSRL